MDLDGEVQYDFFPFIRQYKSGRVVRFGATDTVPAGTDDTAGTGVTSLVEHGDLARVFLVGVSAGANIAHNMAERAGAHSPGVPIRGLLLVHPYFTGGAPVGGEATDTARKARSEALWRYVYPGTSGLDDPLGNPFSEAAGGSAARAAAERVLVCVAEKDWLRGRGVWYYERLKESGYRGEVELHESVARPRGMSSITATWGARKRGCCRRASCTSSVHGECARVKFV